MSCGWAFSACHSAAAEARCRASAAGCVSNSGEERSKGSRSTAKSMGSNSRRARDLRIGAGAGVGLPADRTGAAASEEAIPAVVRVCGFAFDVPARDGAIDSIGTVRSAAIFGARGSAEAAGAVLSPSISASKTYLRVFFW